MKQVKILKRPTAASQPTNPADRVSAELTTMLEAAMSRERARLETVYRQRQEALLRTVSDVLNNSLEQLVTTAAKRETEALNVAVTKVVGDAPTRPNVDADVAKSARECFALAFEKIALPKFEQSVALMLKEVSTAVEEQVDTHLVKPATDVRSTLETASDSLHTVKNDVANWAVDHDAADAAAVQAALDAEDVGTALRLSVGKSVAVQAKAVSGVLDLSVRPEEAFGDAMPPVHDLIKFAALLTMDLTDRTEARLKWLYEIFMMIDDSFDFSEGDPDVVENTRRKLDGTIERLTEFMNGGSATPAQAKHTKLLIRVLKAFVKNAQG